MAATEFVVMLTDNQWDKDQRSWNCPVLRIPGAKLISLRCDGEMLADELYKASYDQGTIKWERAADTRPTIASPESMQPLSATIKLNRKLFSVSVPIVVAAIGLVGTIGSAWISSQYNPFGGSIPPAVKQALSELPLESVEILSRMGEINYWPQQDANRVKLEYKNLLLENLVQEESGDNSRYTLLITPLGQQTKDYARCLALLGHK